MAKIGAYLISLGILGLSDICFIGPKAFWTTPDGTSDVVYTIILLFGTIFFADRIDDIYEQNIKKINNK